MCTIGASAYMSGLIIKQLITILAIATHTSVKSLEIKEKFTRYRARIAYDGQGFAGFQLQTRKNCRTVQGDLEKVFNQRLIGSNVSFQSLRTIKVVAASRTDAGVHARGQAVHFDIPNTIFLHDSNLDDICASFNQMLSHDLRMWNFQRVPGKVIKPLTRSKFRKRDAINYGTNQNKELDSSPNDENLGEFHWNVLFDSHMKLYSYRLCLASVMDPYWRWIRWHPPQAQYLNVAVLRRVLLQYVGTHDFRAFAGAIERTEKDNGMPLETVRTVYAVDLIKEDDAGNFRIDFYIKGALYKQIRNMVGTAIDVCRGEVSEEKFLHLLHQTHPLTRIENRSRPAPPEGLTLENVFFDDPNF